MSQLREILKALMERAGESPQELYARSGVRASTTYRFLKGTHRDPSSRTVKKWANAYNVTESQLRGFVPIDKLPPMPPPETGQLAELLTVEQYAHLQHLKKISKVARHHIQELTALIAEITPEERRIRDEPNNPQKRAGESHSDLTITSQYNPSDTDTSGCIRRVTHFNRRGNL